MTDDKHEPGSRWAGPVIVVSAIIVWVVIIWFFMWTTQAVAHSWYPPRCCSSADCKPIEMDAVRTTPEGFVIPGNPEVVPYSSPKIKQTPPEGQGKYHICTQGGKPDGKVLCLYIPNWGA